MSGTDGSPETPDDAGPPAPQQTPVMRPTRGIDPPTSGQGPPPPPDFGIIAKPTVQPIVDHAAGPMSGHPDTAARRSSSPWAIVAIIVPIVAVLALVVGLAVVGVGNLLELTDDAGEAAPSSGVDDSSQNDPGDDQGPGPAGVESSLQAMIDEYTSARDDGSLWGTIPDSDFNRTALTAFLYLLTDLRLAASFGADTSDYLPRANELEQKLLSQEPLGTDVTITLRDRTFTYDGDTGEGGFTAN